MASAAWKKRPQVRQNCFVKINMLAPILVVFQYNVISYNHKYIHTHLYSLQLIVLNKLYKPLYCLYVGQYFHKYVMLYKNFEVKKVWAKTYVSVFWSQITYRIYLVKRRGYY